MCQEEGAVRARGLACAHRTVVSANAVNADPESGEASASALKESLGFSLQWTQVELVQGLWEAGALCYRAWAHSWSSAALAARSVLPSMENSLEEAWQPTPVFLPGEFHGQGSLVG